VVANDLDEGENRGKEGSWPVHVLDYGRPTAGGGEGKGKQPLSSLRKKETRARTTLLLIDVKKGGDALLSLSGKKRRSGGERSVLTSFVYEKNEEENYHLERKREKETNTFIPEEGEEKAYSLSYLYGNRHKESGKEEELLFYGEEGRKKDSTPPTEKEKKRIGKYPRKKEKVQYPFQRSGLKGEEKRKDLPQARGGRPILPSGGERRSPKKKGEGDTTTRYLERTSKDEIVSFPHGEKKTLPSTREGGKGQKRGVHTTSRVCGKKKKKIFFINSKRRVSGKRKG